MVNLEHDFPSDHNQELKNDLLVSSNKVDVPKASSKFDFIFAQDLTFLSISTDRSLGP